MMRGAFSDLVKVLSFKFTGREKGIVEHPRLGDELGRGEGPGDAFKNISQFRES